MSLISFLNEYNGKVFNVLLLLSGRDFWARDESVLEVHLQLWDNTNGN